VPIAPIPAVQVPTAPPAYTTLDIAQPQPPVYRAVLSKVSKAVDKVTKVEWDDSAKGKCKGKMAQPPRMLLLDGGASGGEAFVALPATYDVSRASTPYLVLAADRQKAVQAATEKFSIPKDTHIVRLTCNASEMPYIGGYAGAAEIFMWAEACLSGVHRIRHS